MTFLVKDDNNHNSNNDNIIFNYFSVDKYIV